MGKERKDVTIHAPVAQAFSRAGAENIQHHCPLCDQTMGWEEFQAHAKACVEAHPEKVREAEERG